VFEKSMHLLSLIQSWIIYTGGFGGGGAGGTVCTMATGFSIFIISMLRGFPTVRKRKIIQSYLLLIYM
jgi:hypothetical protein